jgi:ribosomal protein S20
MPNKDSAMKRMRSDAKKHAQNAVILSELHTRQKRLVTIAKQDPKSATEQARILISKLDKAVSHGVIPHKRADRKKARIARLLATKS